MTITHVSTVYQQSDAFGKDYLLRLMFRFMFSSFESLWPTDRSL